MPHLKIPFLFCSFFFLTYSMAQSFGKQKRATYTFIGENEEYQIPTYQFRDDLSGKIEEISLNNFVFLPGFYEGISLEELEYYIEKKLVVDFIYIQHLCNEGTYDFSCKGWVVSGINEAGTPPSNRKLVLPKIGKIVDPDGYVNVRSQMNVKSPIAGKLEPMEITEECFYFYSCPDPNWYQVDFEYNGEKLKGYIHASRVKIVY